MAVTLVAHTAASSANTTSVTTSAIDTTGATLAVLWVASYSSNPANLVSDSKGNTWLALTASPAGNADTEGQFFYCSNPVVGSGHTFAATAASGGCFPSVFVETFMGAAGTPDITVSAAASDPIQPGSGTPAHDDELILTGVTYAQATSLAVDSGFGITDQLPTQSGVAYGGALAYLVQAGATAEDPSWTGTGIAGVAGMASWQGTGSGAAVPATVTLTDAAEYIAALADAPLYTAALADAPLYTVVLTDD